MQKSYFVIVIFSCAGSLSHDFHWLGKPIIRFQKQEKIHNMYQSNNKSCQIEEIMKKIKSFFGKFHS